MCDVTISNFEEVFPQIEDDIKRCTFVAIDTEFTGLRLSEKDRPSLFDSGQERYRKLRHSVQEFTLCQFGLTAFLKVPDQNKYEAYCYNVYLFPVAFGNLDVKFLCQASSFEFLGKHNFDFNKFVYNGVNFMNTVQEASIRQHLDNQDLFQGLDRDIDERSLQKCCSLVAEWLVSASVGDELVLPDDKIGGLSDYVLHMEMRQRFSQVWTKQNDDQFIVERVEPTKRQHLVEEKRQKEEHRIVNKLLGFTRVFKVLVKHKKPIVGHNNLMDLLFMYEKFHKPLPEKYSTFKMELNKLFPVIYDTKHIASSMRRNKVFEEAGFFQSTALGDLYQQFNSERGRFYVLCSPDFSFAEGCCKYVDTHIPHEAGYDSYMCGYVFLRLAHALAMKDVKSTLAEPLPFRDHQLALKEYTNCVNLIRAAIDHVCISGTDPVSFRPEWLVVQSQNTIYTGQLARLFAPYGSVDIQLRSRTQALVAVGNHRCAKDILKAFKKHEVISVAKYSLLKHSPIVRGMLWAGIVVSTSICAWTLYSGLKNKPP